MSQIKTKFIEDSAVTTPKVNNDAIDGTKVRLDNDQYLRARNAADNGDVNIIKVDTNDAIVVADDVLPATNIAQDLGSSSAKFRDGFFEDGAITVGTGLLPNTWGGDVPGLILDGDSTDATAQGASAVIMKTSNSNQYLTIATQDVNMAGTGPSLQLSTGQNSGAGNSGEFYLQTGNADAGNSGNIGFTAGLSTSGNSGNITLRIAPGGASQGNIVFTKDGQSSTVGDVWTATDTNGAGYWAAAPVGITHEKETFVLDGTDITNQYVDLANVANASSIHFVVKGAPPTIEAYSGSTTEHDYTVNLTGGAGGNTRISFANDLATGGASALIAGDIVQVVYTY